ncbi:MAG: DUF2937 family protein [Pseudomonadota bacterium]
MLGRFIALALGLAAGALGTQAPGFTLQYMQNLSGRVDELRPIVEQFDEQIAQYGYTRQTAMAECDVSTGLLEALCSTYASTVKRFEDLSAHLSFLESVEPLRRPLALARDHRIDIAEDVRERFEPAVPTTIAGGAYGAGGFLLIWGVLSVFFGILGSMFGGGRRYA